MLYSRFRPFGYPSVNNREPSPLSLNSSLIVSSVFLVPQNEHLLVMREYQRKNVFFPKKINQPRLEYNFNTVN